MAIERRSLSVEGRAVGWYDAGGPDDARVVLWHHGTPNIGEPPEPLFDLAGELGLRFVGFDRPGYGGSEDAGPRSVADVAAIASAVADAAGADRFAVMGHSGGGPHALATAAMLPERVTAAVIIAGLAPLVAPGEGPSGLGTSWWDGMVGPGIAELKAALQGAEELEELLRSTEWDPEMFTERDHEVLQGSWRWYQRIAAAGTDGGFSGIVADDVAFVTPWGFSVAEVAAPVLVVHGDDDRVVPAQHGAWLTDAIPGAEAWERPDDGHVSVMEATPDALRWLASQI